MKTFFYLLLTLMLVVIYNASYSQCKSDLEVQNIKGKVKKIEETGISVKDGTNEISHVRITTYDGKGRSLGYTFAHINNEMKPTTTIFEFDKKGNKVREKRLDLNDKVESYLTFKYDSKGNLIEEKFFFSDERLDSYSIYKYNSTCDKAESKTFYSDGGLWLSYKLIYNDGKLIEIFDQLDSTTTKFVNDNQNNYIKKTEYDKFGVVKEVFLYSYEYDKKLNWTKMIYYENGKTHWIDERKYEYYE